MSWAKSKRFYSETGWEIADGGFQVTLDGRAAKTPGGNPLIVATDRLAGAVAGEWAAQEDEIRPETMPMTGLACTAIDRIGRERRAVAGGIAEYGGTDLVCYRAESPKELTLRQQASWQPLVDWAAETLGARLRVTAGIAPVAQPPDALSALEKAVDALDDLELAALAAVTPAAGSLVIGLALVLGHLDAGAAFEASELDEAWQTEKWGADEDDLNRRDGLRREIEAAAAFLGLVRDPA